MCDYNNINDIIHFQISCRRLDGRDLVHIKPFNKISQIVRRRIKKLRSFVIDFVKMRDIQHHDWKIFFTYFIQICILKDKTAVQSIKNSLNVGNFLCSQN